MLLWCYSTHYYIEQKIPVHCQVVEQRNNEGEVSEVFKLFKESEVGLPDSDILSEDEDHHGGEPDEDEEGSEAEGLVDVDVVGARIVAAAGLRGFV